MIIGIQGRGRMKTHNDNYVATQFFVLGIPLIPINSYFQSKSGSTVEIGLNWKSVIKEYLSWIFFIPGLIILVANGINSSLLPHSFPDWIITPLGIILICSSIFFFFMFQKSTVEENELRDLIYSAIGINLHPAYFTYNKASYFQRQLKLELKNKFGIKNWRETVKSFDYNSEQLPIIFAISAFDNRLVSKDSSKQIFEKLRLDYKELISKT